MVELNRLLVVGVIVLFIGLACAPSINANVSKESELFEITTEICGLDGGKHTVQLTKEEAEEVNRVFENIRLQLNESTSREETDEIFNDAVVKLDKYGLLGGLSVTQAQKLVTGRYQDNLKRVLDTGQRLDIFTDYFNIFCLLSAKVTYSEYYFSLYLPFCLLLIVGMAPVMLASAIGYENLANLLAFFMIIILFANPFRIMNFIIFLNCDFDIDTFGLKGFVTSDKADLFGFFGFTGLMLKGLGEETYFLGTSLAVI